VASSYAERVSSNPSPILSQPQLQTLREHGEERRAAVGDVLSASATCATRSSRSSRARHRGAQKDLPSTRRIVARDEHGFILTGPAAGADTLLETNVPRIYAVGDVRSGSTKRCATAVGEGAMVVQLVHTRLSGVPV